MTDATQGVLGLARRRRLTDRETEQRMLDAAMTLVGRAGLTVSLDHISLEDVIRDARVSRSAAYRRWPYKDLFFADLLKALARATNLGTAVEDEGSDLVNSVLREGFDRLSTAQSRHDLVVELIRQGALHDFDTVYRSTAWRTYFALHAAFIGLPVGDLRSEVQAALAASELAFTDRISRSYQRLSALLGYRLRPGNGITFESFASLLLASLTGHVVKALAAPETATRHFQASPFGSARSGEWSLPAIGLGAIAWAVLEPDPDVDWSVERIEWVRSIVESIDR